MNTKPTQGKAFRLNRSHLQNVPIDYDDGAEMRKTNPVLLAFKKKREEPPNADSLKPKPPLRHHRRSVGGDPKTGFDPERNRERERPPVHTERER